MPTYSGKRTLEIDVNYECDIEPYVEGRLSGPPEDCYPSEGGYASLTKVWLSAKTSEKAPDGSDLYKDVEITDFLSAEEDKDMEEQAYEAWCEERGDR